MKKLKRLALSLIALYALILALGYFFQERFMFYPNILVADYEFKFDAEFSEHFIESGENRLNLLHFRTPNPKGAVLFLHGNNKNLAFWGELNPIFRDLGYDFYTYDYPHFGKSTGSYHNEAEIYADALSALNFVRKEFDDENIVIIGFSIGSGISSNLACKEAPNVPNLVLLAPYFSLENLGHNLSLKLFPKALMRYKIKTHENLRQCKAKITIIHGTQDPLISVKNSRELAKILPKSDDKFFEIESRHNDLPEKPEVKEILKARLP